MGKNLRNYTDDTSHFSAGLSTFDQDFQYVGKEEVLRGIYYWDSEKSHIYLHKHERIEDLCNTCVHETIHHCIFKITVDDDEGMGTLSLDMEEEHDIIRNMAWAEYWAVDGYSQIRNSFIKSKIQPDEEKILTKKYNKKFAKEIEKWQ